MGTWKLAREWMEMGYAHQPDPVGDVLRLIQLAVAAVLLGAAAASGVEGDLELIAFATTSLLAFALLVGLWRAWRGLTTLQGPTPGGRGVVYVLDDKVGVKIGHTNGPVERRVRALQTGNPRRISVVAQIFDAGPEVERLIHHQLAKWNTTGEWFDRERVVRAVYKAGGMEPWLRALLGGKGWRIHVTSDLTH